MQRLRNGNRTTGPLLSFFWALTFLAVTSFLFPVVSSAKNVPVAPNMAIVEGTVMEFCLASSSLYNISPEQVLYRLVVSIEATEDEGGIPNFVSEKVGQTVAFFTKVKPPSDVLGRRIRVRVEYMGDEKGGRFWINVIEKIY